MTDLGAIDPVLDGYDRGLPSATAGMRVSAVGDQGWSLHADLDTPVATIHLEHVTHNLRLMQEWCADRDAELWPHAKTIMSPELTRLQRDAGADGLTAATFAQARLLLDWGSPAVLIANQVVQPRAAAWLATAIAERGAHVASFVDSVEGIQVLEAAAAAAGIQFEVLIELGAPGARSGVRDKSEIAPLRAQLDASPHVRLVGVAGYEGSFGADRSADALSRVDLFLENQTALLSELVSAGDIRTDNPVFSAGGSMFFDRVDLARKTLGFPHRLVLRSGCYLLHDVGLFHRATPLPDSPAQPGLRNALSVWGTVHSRPEPTRAYLDIGRRDAGFDQGLPSPLRRVPAGSTAAEPFTAGTTVQLNDHHLHLEIDGDSPIRVGDRIEFGVSHPCTTMDKWRTLAVIDGADAVVGAVSTRF